MPVLMQQECTGTLNKRVQIRLINLIISGLYFTGNSCSHVQNLLREGFIRKMSDQLNTFNLKIFQHQAGPYTGLDLSNMMLAQQEHANP